MQWDEINNLLDKCKANKFPSQMQAHRPLRWLFKLAFDEEEEPDLCCKTKSDEDDSFAIEKYGPKSVKQMEMYNNTLFDDLAREKKAIQNW